MKSCEIGDTLYVGLLLVLCYVWVVAPPQTKWSLTVYKNERSFWLVRKPPDVHKDKTTTEGEKKKKPRKRGRINKTVIKINVKKQEEIQVKCSVSLLSVFSWTWWWTRKEEEDLANRKGKEEEIKMDGRQWKKKKKATNGLETRHGKIPLLLSRSVSRDVAVLRARDGAIYSMQQNKNPSQVHSLYTANGSLSSSTRLFTSTRLFFIFSRLLLLLPFCFVLIAFSVVAVGPRKYQRDRKRLLRGGSTW